MGCTPDADPVSYALANPMALLPLGCRQLLVTGDNDVNVPAELTRKYAAAAKRAGDPTVLLNAHHLPRERVRRTRTRCHKRTLRTCGRKGALTSS
jgi:pimeloyl-ACP methyl ester carboxylesterase